LKYLDQQLLPAAPVVQAAPAFQVVAVDCNPAQSALLELKANAIKHLSHDDTWRMFGEGRHPRFQELYEKKLAPFMSQKAMKFWGPRQWYFRMGFLGGLYYQGGMVRSSLEAAWKQPGSHTAACFPSQLQHSTDVKLCKAAANVIHLLSTLLQCRASKDNLSRPCCCSFMCSWDH
jgi:Protein of unknown function (DUF3419)